MEVLGVEEAAGGGGRERPEGSGRGLPLNLGTRSSECRRVDVDAEGHPGLVRKNGRGGGSGCLPVRRGHRLSGGWGDDRSRGGSSEGNAGPIG